MDGEGQVEVYEVRDCGACVAVCPCVVDVVFVDYCYGGGALGGGSGEGEEGSGGRGGTLAFLCCGINCVGRVLWRTLDSDVTY